MLNVYHEICELDDNKLDEYISKKITELEKISYLENGCLDLVGFDVSYNPTDFRLTENDISDLFIGVKTIHYGYVRKNTKIGYGLSLTNGIPYNSGGYYYVDDDSYIYDFCKYIKNKEVAHEFSLFTHILSFVRKYYGIYPMQHRNEIFKMIVKNDWTFFDPIEEHKLSDLKGTGAGMCTEFALAAGNLLTFFGFDNYMIIGSMSNSMGKGSHAFNIISYTNESTKDDDAAIVDFSSNVLIYDHDYNIIGRAPYILPIEKFDEKFLENFLCNEKHIVSDDYDMIKIGDKLFQIVNGEQREYFVSHTLNPTYYYK